MNFNIGRTAIFSAAIALCIQVNCFARNETITNFNEYKATDMIGRVDAVINPNYKELIKAAAKFSEISGYDSCVGGDQEQFEEIDDYILLLNAMLYQARKDFDGKMISVTDAGKVWIFKFSINGKNLQVNFKHRDQSWLNYDFINQVNKEVSKVCKGKFYQIEPGGRGKVAEDQSFEICYLTLEKEKAIKSANKKYILR